MTDRPEPWDLLGEIELEPPEEKRLCEVCRRRRLCALFPTIAGQRWLCRKCRQLFSFSGYQLYLLGLYGKGGDA